MKGINSFAHWQLVNGESGDPALLLRLARSGEHLLFDCGDLSALSKRELTRTKSIFVTHGHVDHFFGLDRIIRSHIPLHRTVTQVFGPPGIQRLVQGKLNGYLWNLLVPGQMEFHVHELDSDDVLCSWRLRWETGFDPEAMVVDRSERSPYSLVRLSDGTIVSALTLDHGTPVLAFAARRAESYSVDLDALKALGLEPGPWLRDLQRNIGAQHWDFKFEFLGKKWDSADLASKIFRQKPSETLIYLTDFAFSWANIERIKKLTPHCEIVFCESSFLDCDRQKAKAKKHLSSKQAALIAAYLGAKTFIPFHFSQIYKGHETDMQQELQKFWQCYHSWDEKQIALEITAEIARPSA